MVQLDQNFASHPKKICFLIYVTFFKKIGQNSEKKLFLDPLSKKLRSNFARFTFGKEKTKSHPQSGGIRNEKKNGKIKKKLTGGANFSHPGWNRVKGINSTPTKHLGFFLY